ncbi:MAG: hydantoinase B/oxoprolinase family protein, partial [Pseudomonadales bacterium]
MGCVNAELNAVELAVFSSRLESVCEEMGAVLQRSAFSPNIKDRLDFSCAVFDAAGELSAQAAHIPVHLGSMAFAMAGIVERCTWQSGDMVVVNDPYLGGTHLPDVTVIAPVFTQGQLIAFIANRAHHANIGATSPGSMPISTCLEEEGIVIAPTHLLCNNRWQQTLMERLGDDINRGDFVAQVSANRVGVDRLAELIAGIGMGRYHQALRQLNDYGYRTALSALREIPQGRYRFSDVMDDDGAGLCDIPIVVELTVSADGIAANFSGTAEQVPGNINCPLSVVAAAVFYVFRCLMPANVPSCAGTFRPITLSAPEGCLINARSPAAVAAGNVETSTRITDVVLGALAQALPNRIPAASHGSMNNIAMGAKASGAVARWDYYETIGGGMGASACGDGLSGVQTHMTNTLNTPIESLEMHYPLRVIRYQLREGSSGKGLNRGGEGIIREFEFLNKTSVTLLTERRTHAPWGLAGGKAGQPGENRLNGELLVGKCQLQLKAGDRLSLVSAG